MNSLYLALEVDLDHLRYFVCLNRLDNIEQKLLKIDFFWKVLSRHCGLLIIFIVGAIVDYHVVPCIFAFLPIVFLISFIFLPNTPQYHLQRGSLEKAEKALKFYKGYKGDSEQEKIALEKEFERLKLLAEERKKDDKIRFNDFGIFFPYDFNFTQ